MGVNHGMRTNWPVNEDIGWDALLGTVNALD